MCVAYLCGLSQCALCFSLLGSIFVNSPLQRVQLVGLFLDQHLSLLLSAQSLTELHAHTLETLVWHLNTHTRTS